MTYIIVSDPHNRFKTEEARDRAKNLIKKNYPLPLMAKNNSGNINHIDGYHIWFNAGESEPSLDFKGFSFSILKKGGRSFSALFLSVARILQLTWYSQFVISLPYDTRTARMVRTASLVRITRF